MAGLTGLEPATSDVTGRRSNQLNYNPARGGTQPARVVAAAVTICLGLLSLLADVRANLVGGTGLEPVTAGV